MAIFETGLVLAGGMIGAACTALLIRRATRRAGPASAATRARAQSESLLVDRPEFEVRLARLFDSVHDEACQHTLLCIALDGLARIEDDCGALAVHAVCDGFCELLGSKVRRNDTLARIERHEFAALLPLCPLDQGLRIANAIREATREHRFEWRGRSFMLGANVGLVPLDGASGSVEEALAAAEQGLNEAKRRGGDRVHVHQLGQGGERFGGDAGLLSRLSHAFERGDFVLFQQPIRPLRAAVSSSHFEILVRLRGDDGTLIGPATFLPIAERYNLLAAIDRLVVTEMLKVLSARVHGRGDSIAPEAGLYALNLSGASINDSSFLDFVRGEIGRYGVPASLLCFEITETVAISNLAKAADLMHQLKALGCRFALDDFGIGMSSFAYLKYLPVDFLKIDGIFVKDMHLDEMDYAIVEGLNRIAHTLGMQTVAEVVEHGVTLDLLRALGVDYAQGNHIAAPEPLAGPKESAVDATRPQ